MDLALEGLRPERPPALLLDAGLSLLRPLGFAGIPAIIATANPSHGAFYSRYCKGRIQLPSLVSPEALVEALLEVGDGLASRLGRRVPLYYGNDEYLNLIYSRREQIEQRFLMLLNEPDVCRALIDKELFQAFARERGFPVPRLLSWEKGQPDALEGAAGPVLVKPKVKAGWDETSVKRRLVGDSGKACIFANGREAMAHPVVRQFREQLAFQEFIPGDDRHLWSFHGYADENGELLAWFIGRKLRTAPALTGMSSFLELAHDEELAALGRDIVARVPLRGVFKIDFKRDADSGRFVLLEINARYNLWHHMGAMNGVNLLQVAYDYLVDRVRPGPTQYRTTYRWLSMRHDIRAYRELAARGELTFYGWLASLCASPKVYALFSWNDPVPCVHVLASRVKSRLRRSFVLVRSWLYRWLFTAS